MLKLNSLHLEHFMCVTEADLNFDANCVIIEGDNGQGKSAIMEAVAICLSERKRSDSVKEFIQKGYEHAKIILDLTFNNEKILFDVNLNMRCGTPLERDVLYKGKHYINSEVTPLINELEFTFYSDIIISMQGADDIASTTPTLRLNLLQKLFQFDFTDEVKPIQNKIEEFYKSKIINTEKIDFLEKANTQKKQTLDSLKEKDYNFSKDEYDSFKKELEEKIKELDSINELIAQNNSLLQKSIMLKEKLRLSSSRKDLLLKDIENNKKVDQELQNIDYKNKKAILEKEIEDIKKQVDEINNNILNLKIEIKNHRDQYSISQNKMGEETATQKSLIKKLELCKAGVCPECGQKTDGIHIEQIEKDKKENENIIKSLLTDIETCNKEISELEKMVADDRKKSELLNRSVAEKESEIIALDTLYSNIESRRLSQDKIVEINNEIKNIDDLVLQINNESKSLEQEILINNNKTNNRDLLKKDCLDLQQRISDSDEVYNYNKTINIQKKSLEKDISDNLSLVNSLKDSLVQLDNDISTYSEVIKVLDKELPNYLVVKTCARLEKEMNDFVNVVFPSFRLRLLRSKRGVEFFYTTDDKVNMQNLKQLINSKMASGYEKSVLGLAFKVALCKAYNLSFIALDEIDAAASEGNSVLTMESLIGSNIFNQIFFITHKEATRDIIKSLSDRVICYHVSKGVFSNEED